MITRLHSAIGTVVSELPKIVAGPYLLAPTQHSMAIRWETDRLCDLVVEYGVSAANGRSQATAVASVVHTPVGTTMHEAVLSGLKTDTTYWYKIVCCRVPVEAGTFKTLPAGGDPIRFAIVADTHFFHTADAFTDRMLELKPDFIVHCGDIVRSSGIEHEQFKENYFGPVAELIKHIPVVYVHGNHDMGQFWDMYFGSQAELLGSSDNPYWFSFDAGDAHFVVLDGMPFEDEPERFIASYDDVRGRFDGYVRNFFAENTADGELAWLLQDLSPKRAQNAAWRLVFQHYPYTDPEVAEALSAIMEEHRVEGFFGGHRHLYDRRLLLHSNGLPRMVAVTCGLGQQVGGSVEYGVSGLEGSVGAHGSCEYVTVELDGDVARIAAHTSLSETGNGRAGVIDRFTFGKGERSSIAYRDCILPPCSVGVDETFTVAVSLINEGGTGAMERVELWIDGLCTDSKWVNVDAGETEEVKFGVSLCELGSHTIRIGPFEGEIVAHEKAGC